MIKGYILLLLALCLIIAGAYNIYKTTHNYEKKNKQTRRSKIWERM